LHGGDAAFSFFFLAVDFLFFLAAVSKLEFSTTIGTHREPFATVLAHAVLEPVSCTA
jgi:hypothetical protein